VKKLLLILVTSIFLLSPFKVWAASETINSFDTNITAHKNGTFDVKETIVYDFGSNNRRGIYRNIPTTTKVGELIRVITINVNQVLLDGNPESYTISTNSTEESVKIGQADQTISGVHTYTIFYTVGNGIGSNYADHDELYWNVTGNDWEAPIYQASVSFTDDFGVLPNRVACYTGSAGSTAKNCDFNGTSDIFTTKPLNAREGLTAVWGFPKGTFPESVLQKPTPSSTSFSQNSSGKYLLYVFLAIPIILNLLLFPAVLWWYLKNKKKERFGPPKVNFDLPEDRFGQRITPAEAGSIDNARVEQNDVIATIFDLAIRKYIKLESVKAKKVLGVFGSDEDYLIKKLKEPDEELQSFEKTLMDRLFKEGNEVKISSLNKDFYETFGKFEKEVFNRLIARSIYIENPKNKMALFLTFGILLIFVGGILLGPLLIFLSFKLNGRTATGDQLDWQIDGLKIFLKNMSREHTWQAKNLYTVEKYIPYAMAFGFIKEFMEELKVIYPDYHPTWYAGNVAFYQASDRMFTSMNSSFTTHAASSSSGFSGGSSGGGGGGGGGGSW
jgi:uncharacterized membrane protein